MRAGVYVGDYPARTRKRIWGQVEACIETGDAVMVWKAPTDQGFDCVTVGQNRRTPVDFDGLKLVSFLPQNRVETTRQPGKLFIIVNLPEFQSHPESLFPASAGMNRAGRRGADGANPVPRERGDEPIFKVSTPMIEGCSPRARG